MATIEDFRAWFHRDLSRYSKWNDDVEIVRSDEVGSLDIRIYTDVHSYRISASNPRMRKYPVNPPQQTEGGSVIFDPDGPTVERMSEGYLGCLASCRKPRAGEDWTRGSDLADGPLTEETWHRILGDILSYELVRIHRAREPQADIPQGA